MAEQTELRPAPSSSEWRAQSPNGTPRAPVHRALQLRISERRLMLALGDIAASVGAVYLALRMWAYAAGVPSAMEFMQSHLFWFAGLPVCWVILAQANDYYSLRCAARLRTSLARLLVVTAQLLLFYMLLYFLSPRDLLPRKFILFYALVSVVLIGLWRGCRVFLVGWTAFRRRVLIVGNGLAADMIAQAIRDEAPTEYEVVGRVHSAFDLAALSEQTDLLGTGTDLPVMSNTLGVTSLIMAYINDVPDDVFQGAMACYEQGLEIVAMTRLYEEITGRIPVEHVGEHLWTLVLPTEEHSLAFYLYMVMKRLLDVLVALAGLLIFLPILVLLAMVIKLGSRGPLIYRQERLGRGGRTFTLLKLRSMVADAESRSGPQWATAGDPRVTRVGRLLRKTRLDEVPQLVNVLKGEMSLVGPRPERSVFVDRLARDFPFYRSRLAVKPGLTGWAQVRYRYGSNKEDALKKLQYDLYYIRHQSLSLDLLILARTVGTVLLLRGT